MKNFYYLFLIFSLFSFSQETFIMKNGGTVLQNGIKISPTDLRLSLIKTNKL
jgi:hypothetical protein